MEGGSGQDLKLCVKCVKFVLLDEWSDVLDECGRSFKHKRDESGNGDECNNGGDRRIYDPGGDECNSRIERRVFDPGGGDGRTIGSGEDGGDVQEDDGDHGVIPYSTVSDSAEDVDDSYECGGTASTVIYDGDAEQSCAHGSQLDLVVGCGLDDSVQDEDLVGGAPATSRFLVDVEAGGHDESGDAVGPLRSQPPEDSDDNGYDGEPDVDDVTGGAFPQMAVGSEVPVPRVDGGRAHPDTLVTVDALKVGRVSIVSKTSLPTTVRWVRGRLGRSVEKVPWSSELLDGIAPGDIPQGSALFYSLSKEIIGPATVAGIIDEAAIGKTSVNFIVWVNRHWVATELVPGVSWRIYDSARSLRNENTIREWGIDIGLPIPTFPSVPQQRYYSDECGIFAFLFMHHLARGIRIPTLRPLPKRLLPRAPSLKSLTSLLTDPNVAAAAGWKILDDYYESCNGVQWSKGGGSVYEIGTHLRVRWHWMGKPEMVLDERAIVTRQYGTKRSTTHVLTFEASSDLSGGTQIFTLPPASGSNVVVVEHGVDDRPHEARIVTESDPNSDHEDHEAEEEHHRFYEEFLSETRVETYGEPDSKASTGFRPITVGEFLKAKIRDLNDARETCPALVWTAMVTDTRKGHIKELKGLQDYARENLPGNHPLDYAIARYADDARRTRSLSWSTVSRILQSLIGAFAVFPNYATGVNEEFPPILIHKWPGVRDSLKTAKRLSNVVGVREPVAATAAQVAEALGTLDAQDRVFLQMCWLTSQRPGDVVHVRYAHINMIADKAIIRFAEGKNHASTDPYAIHCVVPQQWLADWTKSRSKKRKWMFDIPTESARASLMRRIRVALRKTAGGKDLENRSLRRGSLQIMAENGANVAELLKFSRHQDAKTLRRYLVFDSVADAENQRASEHTRILGGGSSCKGSLHDIEVARPESWCSIRKDGDVVFGALPKPHIVQDRSNFTYHIKDIPPMLLDEISKLAESTSQSVRKDWEEVRKFLEDPASFAGAVKNQPLQSRVRRKMIQQLKGVKQIREVQVSVAKNFCLVFVVPEDEKTRWRIIKHPKDINDALQEIVDELEVGKTNASRRASRFRVIDHPGCIEFDFAGYFDQFPLTPEVAEHFVFHHGAKYYAPSRMPMGVSFAVAVATAATRVLTYGIDEGLDVAVEHQIDNVRIAGSETDCDVAAQRFLGRCERAGVTLNKDYKYSSENDFMGDVVDFRTKMICCRKKQLNRLAVWMVKVRRPEATYRDWFACYGTAVYMAEALGTTPAQHLRVRLFMRELARALARAPVLWDERMLVPPPWEAWERFVGLVHNNSPAKLVPHPDTVANLFVDASEWGLGALCIGPDGERNYKVRQWSPAERGVWGLGHSTVAEPRALVEAAKWVHDMHPSTAVHVFTDHRPFVDAFWKCGSFSPGYNDAILELGRMGAPLVLHHIAGALMPADGLSRGRSTEPTRGDWDDAAGWVEDSALSSLRYYRIIGGGIGARTFASSGSLNPPCHVSKKLPPFSHASVLPQ